MTNNTEILRTEGLKRSYLVNETKIDVLKGINLTINNQEFIAIMGKSGSGKTTLLKLLGLLDRPTEGKVFFKGEDSKDVYKRQAVSPSTGQYSTAQEIEIKVPDGYTAYYTTDKSEPTTSSTTVSYTHLDVYKRQLPISTRFRNWALHHWN